VAAALPLAAFVLLSAGALVHDLAPSLPGAALPQQADWAEAAAALRSVARPGDAVQPWPPWLERARLVIDAAPVVVEEDLAAGDLFGVSRLWLLALPGVPFGGLERARRALASRGAVRLGELRRFGPLELEAWDLRAPEVTADPLGHGPFPGPWPEWHEVQYVARRCRPFPPGSPAQPATLSLGGVQGRRIELRAGIIGGQAYDFGGRLRVDVVVVGAPGSAPLAAIELGRTVDPAPAWLAASAELPPGAERGELLLRASSSDGARPPLCVALWTTR
jgi:hypothetical protein